MAVGVEVEYERRTPGSQAEHRRAATLLAVDGSGPDGPPRLPYLRAARGAAVEDLDGNAYLDFALVGGAAVAGHANPAVVEAVTEQAGLGLWAGAPTPLAADLAAELRRRCPVVELVALTGSGAAANRRAAETARAATGRPHVLAIAGAFAGAGPPAAGGVEPAFGDLDRLERALERWGDQVAAVVVEPVATRAGLLAPAPGYLAGVRALADRHGALLVFDEVRAGWRIGPGGATAGAGVRPDLVTMGEWLGGGMPIGAVGGRAGVLAAGGDGGDGASPLAVAAALACATGVLTEAAHAAMERCAARLADGLRAIAEACGLPVTVTRVGAAGSVRFTGPPAAWRRWWLGMLNHGVIPTPPAWHEPWTVSAAHTEADVDRALDAAEAAFGRVFGV